MCWTVAVELQCRKKEIWSNHCVGCEVIFKLFILRSWEIWFVSHTINKSIWTIRKHCLCLQWDILLWGVGACPSWPPGVYAYAREETQPVGFSLVCVFQVLGFCRPLNAARSFNNLLLLNNLWFVDGNFGSGIGIFPTAAWKCRHVGFSDSLQAAPGDDTGATSDGWVSTGGAEAWCRERLSVFQVLKPTGRVIHAANPPPAKLQRFHRNAVGQVG